MNSKTIISIALSAILMAPLPCDARGLFNFKSKKKAQTEQKADKPTPRKVSKYDRTFTNSKSCVTARCDDGFMAVHKLTGKLYLEIPLQYLGREMMIASTISGSSAADIGSIGYKPTDPMHVRFEKVDSTIFMNEVTVLPDYDTSSAAMGKAVRISSKDPILNSFKLFCYNNDSSAVVFEVTSVFATNYDKLSPVKSGSTGGVNITASYNSSGTALGEIKAFKDNVTIKTTLSYNVSADLLKLVLIKKNEPYSVDVTRTILLLPEKKMRPRVADTRVGIFLVDRLDLNPDVDNIQRYSVIKKWDVQPSDTAAWLRGETVEPLKPITYYIDDAFPENWKESVKRGALRWNKAFEEIGLRNVIRAVDFPADDPSFDPDDLKYSCIRYVPSMIANAMGPSWCDPSTGEIINASVIVYNDVIKMVNNWRFLQTSQLSEEVRGRKLEESILKESIEYVVAHEVGHTLGFMHNMAASAAYPVDSLRSAAFTAEYGTTASIMDYARFNYVAQPEDKGVKLTPPFLGPYDYFLVKYAYCPVPEAPSMKEEAGVLAAWVDEKSGNPLYRYGRQQVVKQYDPTALSEDLGDDAIKASDYGIRNLKYILSHFNEWMDNEIDPDATLRTTRYEELAKQYNRYLGNVMANIGGIKLTAVKPGTPGKTAEPVSKELQRRSLKWMIDQLRNCGWIEDRSVTGNFTMRLDLHTILQYYTAVELFETSHNVMLASRLADDSAEAYTLGEWCSDLYDGIWGPSSKGRAFTDADRILQTLYTQYLIGEVNKKSAVIKVSTSSLDGGNLSVDRMISLGLDPTGGLAERHIDLLRDLDSRMGQGYVASQMLSDEFGAPGYGWQYKMNLRTVDNSKEVYYGELVKIRKLLERLSLSSQSVSAKTHYSALLHEINKALNED